MIVENDIKMLTEAQWNKKHRAILKRQRGKGMYREWRTPRGMADAVFYRQDQTRPYNKRELQAEKRKKSAERKAKQEQLEKEMEFQFNRVVEVLDKMCPDPADEDMIYTNMDLLDEAKELLEYIRYVAIEKIPKRQKNLIDCAMTMHAEMVQRVEQLEADYKLHTAWQWLKAGRVVNDTAIAILLIYDIEGFSSEWYYYRYIDTHVATKEEYDRLKALYIATYGGWDEIDLEHTTYDGHKWW